MVRFHLRPDVELWVTYRDRTFFGSPVGSRPDVQTRELFAPVLHGVEGLGGREFARRSSMALAQVVTSPEFAEVAERDGRGGWRVHSKVLYPVVERACPHILVVARPDTSDGVKARLPSWSWSAVHDLIAALSGPGHDEAWPLPTEAGQLLAGMRQQGLVEVVSEPDELGRPLGWPEITFGGHNTVVVRSATTSIVVDPFLFAHRTTYPTSYQPVSRHELGSVDAIALTHSHPDHLDPGSLLRFARDTRVFVPCQERETILSVDMAARIRQLGFDYVTPLGWGERFRVGDIEIAALPFYGEQPAADDVMHPEIRNAGNTYVVRTPTLSAAFVADSGRDPTGDVRKVASDWRAREGPVDFVFSGYRGWFVYPAQLLFSSVSRFLLFVPPSLWGTRQQLMNGVDDAIDLAELWGAQYLVPYADGGAPWYWERGLGPRLDGNGRENLTFDPYPERVVEAARMRAQTGSGLPIDSPVEVLLLRPGDSMSVVDQIAKVVRTAGHSWPYGSGEEPSDKRQTDLLG